MTRRGMRWLGRRDAPNAVARNWKRREGNGGARPVATLGQPRPRDPDLIRTRLDFRC